MVIRLTIGKDIINPAKDGLFRDSQLAKEIIKLEIITLNMKNPINLSQRSF